jgi:hypothetical protein
MSDWEPHITIRGLELGLMFLGALRLIDHCKAFFRWIRNEP